MEFRIQATYIKTKFTIGNQVTENLQEVESYMSTNDLTELSGTTESGGVETITTIETNDFTIDSKEILAVYFDNADTNGDGVISDEEAGNAITGITDSGGGKFTNP